MTGSYVATSFVSLRAGLLAFAFAFGLVAHAQTPPVAAPTVREHLADLVLLASIVPLKLTPAQIDALLPPIRASYAAAARMRKQEEDELKELAAEIAKAHQEALTGKPIPEEVEKRYTDASRAFLGRFRTVQRDAVKEVLSVAKEQFNADQKAEVEKQSEAFFGGKRIPKQYQKDPSKAPKDAVQELALTAFVEQVLLSDRCATLLEKMKAAKP